MALRGVNPSLWASHRGLVSRPGRVGSPAWVNDVPTDGASNQQVQHPRSMKAPGVSTHNSGLQPRSTWNTAREAGSLGCGGTTAVIVRAVRLSQQHRRQLPGSITPIPRRGLPSNDVTTDGNTVDDTDGHDNTTQPTRTRTHPTHPRDSAPPTQPADDDRTTRPSPEHAPRAASREGISPAAVTTPQTPPSNPRSQHPPTTPTGQQPTATTHPPMIIRPGSATGQ